MEKIKIKEADIQKSIREYLDLRGLLYIRNNTGAMISEYKGKKRFMRFGSTGSPDFLVWKDGKSYGIEIKGSAGEQSPEQRAWQLAFEKEGGIYILVKKLDDAQKYL